MTSDNIETVQDLINYLLTCDPEKHIFVYDYEWGTEQYISHIENDGDAVIIYP